MSMFHSSKQHENLKSFYFNPLLDQFGIRDILTALRNVFIRPERFMFPLCGVM